MNNVIFYAGGYSLTRHGAVMALAVLAAVTIPILLAARRRRGVLAVLTAAVIGLPVGLLLSKLVYWYCCYERFDGPMDALSRVGQGGHSLVGAMAGALTGLLAASPLFRQEGGFLALADCAAPGGALGICIGRLASFYSTSDKGNILITDEKLQKAPYAYAVTDSVTGAVVWRFSSFFFEAIAAAVIFVICIFIFYFLCGGGENKKRTGSTAMMFFSLFGAAQAVLESTRYDSLYLRSNGFVSLMQITAAVLVVTAFVYFSVLTVRGKGFRPLYGGLWGAVLLLLGTAGFMEYYVQRHADMYRMCYSVMLTAMLLCSAVTFGFCLSAGEDDKQRSV